VSKDVTLFKLMHYCVWCCWAYPDYVDLSPAELCEQCQPGSSTGFSQDRQQRARFRLLCGRQVWKLKYCGVSNGTTRQSTALTYVPLHHICCRFCFV